MQTGILRNGCPFLSRSSHKRFNWTLIVNLKVSSVSHLRVGQSSPPLLAALWALSTWFNIPRDRHLATKIIEQAAEVASNIVGKHSVYSNMIDIYYPERAKMPGDFDRVDWACESQIAISKDALKAMRREHDRVQKRMLKFDPHCEKAPFRYPVHRGIKQLAIICEKQKNFDSAIDLCKTTKKHG